MMDQKQKIILFLLACVNFTHILDFMIMMPMGPQLMKIFQIDPQKFAFAVSSYSITAGVSGFAAAFFVDRFDRKNVLLFAYAGFILGTFSCALAPNYGFLVAARVVAGLFGGLIGAQVMAIVSDSVPFEKRGQAMGIVMTAFSAASVAGVPLGLWLASRLSWHAPFWAVGSIGLVNVLMLWRFLPPMTRHLEARELRQNPLEILASIARNPSQRMALVLSAVMMLGHFSMIPFIAPSLVKNVGFAESNLFLIYLVGGALTIFSAPMVGKLADRRGKYPVFVLFALLSLVPMWLITNLQPEPLWVVLMISGFFFVAINGRMIPAQALGSSVVEPRMRGAFMGINSSVTQFSSGLAATIGGWLVHENAATGRLEGYPTVGYFGMAMILACLFLAKKVKPIE